MTPAPIARALVLVGIVATFGADAMAQAKRRNVIEDEALVPAYTLPDLLACSDGTRVTDAAAWTAKRRPELLELFQTQEYGRIPKPPASLRVEVQDEDREALGGKATRLQLRVHFDGTPDGPAASLLVYVPNARKGPAPAFLGLNFTGNHTVHPDPAILMPPPTEEAVRLERTGARGSVALHWPIETILDRGYAVATAWYFDIDPDFDDGFKNGVHPLFVAQGQDPAAGDFTGSIGAWAWGLSRLYDALADRPEIDPKRIAVHGHSRLGKTALWAGAQDERFALVVSNDSGEGGAALARRHFGETTAIINTAFPHWFCKNFKAYNENEPSLPFDQHELIALIAPRPVLVLSAQDDLWADPKGEFLSALAADPVYRLLGTDGLPVKEWPAVNTPALGTIGYHIRPGKHDILPQDWGIMLDFADKHLAGTLTHAR
jgi:hypothetical protein